MTATTTLHALAADYWEFRLREYPVLAHDIGDKRYRRELFHESIADFQRRDAKNSGFLERLSAIDLQDLSPADGITHQLLAREIGEDREHYAFASHLRPVLFPVSPEGMVAHAMQKTVIRDLADAECFLERLRTLSDYFAHQQERLLAGVAAGYRLPRAVYARVCASVSAYCEGPVDAHACYRPLAVAAARDPQGFAGIQAAGLKLMEERVLPAFRRWLDALRAYEPNCRDSVGISEEPEGANYYAFLARHFTTTKLTPAEIHAIGLDEVARITAAMNAVAAEAGYADNLAGMRDYVASDPRFVAESKDALRERLQILSKRIERRIPEFFGRIPRMTYGIESIPEALSAQLPPAYAQPNPPSGLTSGVFWVTSLPARCPVTMHVPITMHEAWPGHLMHIALLQEMTELPAFRRYGLGNYTAYIEGWAMYCEQLGYDFGLYDDPFARFGQYDMEIWRAVRLVVDSGLHAMGWTRAEAIRYMATYVTLPQEAIEAEIDRYIGWPGQALGYKLGELKVRELRKRAEQRLGPAMDLRALHDRFSDCGPVTLDLLDEHIEAWISAAEPRAA